MRAQERREVEHVTTWHSSRRACCGLPTTLFSALRDLDNAIVRCMQVQVQVQVQVHACTRAARLSIAAEAC